VGEFLRNPWIQGGLGPLLAGIAAALVFYPVRLSGLAAACGFFAAVYLSGQLEFEKKLLMVAAAATLLGALVDLAFRPTRTAGLVLGLAFGIAACWIFLSVIGGMPARRLVPYALGLTVLVAGGSAGFLVVALVLARRMVAGASFTLSIGVIGAALAAAVALQRGLLWYHAALLALVPLAVRLPVPQGSAAGQASVALVYALAVAGGACAFVWMR